MSEQEVQLVELLEFMHTLCFVRGDEIHQSLVDHAQHALDAGYWSDAFQPILYDRSITLEEIRTSLGSHIVELGGSLERDHEHAERLELSYYLRKLVETGADVLAIGYRLFEDLNYEWAVDGGPKHLHCHDLAMEYYVWAYDYAEWMQGQEYADKMHEVKTSVKKLAQEWLDQHAVPSPFDRL